MKKLLCIGIFLMVWQVLPAQELHFDRMSIADGLSSNSVYHIFQDSHGMIWLGTLDGLNRFDGYDIKIYRHDKLKSNSLSNNRITHIREDKSHQLWLYDEFSSVLNRYNPRSGKFYTYYLDAVAGHELEIPDTLYINKQGLYIQSELGYRLQHDAAKDAFSVLPKIDSAILNQQKRERNASLLTAFDHYLKEIKSNYNTKNIRIRKVIRDSDGRYWIATRFDGLFTATKANGHYIFTSHLRATDSFDHINSEEIYDVFEDRSNVIWVGTKNSGVYTYSKFRYKFDHIQEVQLPQRSFTIGTVRALLEDEQGTLWAGTNEQGLLKIEKNHRDATLYRPDPNNARSIGHRFIRALWTDADKQLWVGHYDGYSLYHAGTGDFTRYMPADIPLDKLRVYSFKGGRNKTIWMAGWDVVLNFDPTVKRYTIYSRETAKENGFVIENVRELLLDDDHDLWMAAGEKGLCIYNKETGKFTTIRSEPGVANSLPSNNIFDIMRDSGRRIWLATADGLCEFDPQRHQFTNYTVNEGLPGNLVYGILEDRHGFLWLSTTKGISRFDPVRKTFRNYDESDGLQSNEFSENAFFQNDAGVMMFGGINGITIFHPDFVPDNAIPPQVAITNLKVFDKPLSEAEAFDVDAIDERLMNEEEIILTPEQRSVSFEFVALHFVNPKKNNYAYMLEGFDKDWIYRNANIRFANYTNLEPGTYYFKVKASNSDGVWNLNPVRLKITIKPPFYATWWFRIASGLCVVLAGVWAYRKRIATIRKEQSLKSIQLESELAFLKSQVNPHFLFNTFNNIYALCQVNSKNAAPMVGKVSEMMRYMIYDCAADRVPLQKEIEYLRNYMDLNQLKSARRLNTEFSIEGSPDGLRIVPLLLINFLENSFKHSDIYSNGDGFIQMRLHLEGQELSFTIINSFRERSIQNNNQTGIGLTNVKHRLALLYAGKHTLRLEKNTRIFEVQLKLKLD
ncbi:MAG TPA: two-component regulator propeller domain-containing protein [Ohtaekwangia sp.]|uniref:ligand-binding sensor domain-containing protein n=1 Tax=Ohtaekwangia sp. TaxID=2066019 RepID=UPI002F92B44E